MKSGIALQCIHLAAACGAALLLGVQTYADQTGIVVAWGGQVLPWVQPGTRFTAIAAGEAHNLVRGTDATPDTVKPAFGFRVVLALGQP